MESEYVCACGGRVLYVLYTVRKCVWCVGVCVWVVWHLADWFYYLSLPLLHLEHLLRKFVLCVCFHVHVFFMQVHVSANLHLLWTHPCMRYCSLNCCVIVGSPLCVCLTFHNCIITRSVSSCKKWVHCNLQHMPRADTCPWLWTWVEWLPHQPVLIHPSMWGDTCCCGWI